MESNPSLLGGPRRLPETRNLLEKSKDTRASLRFCLWTVFQCVSRGDKGPPLTAKTEEVLLGLVKKP